ncbi:hypothetical protein F511_08325 [Dorcoceras hygrometricum]|uniref:Uncharacterized protein n=1 Tax=Dorcoceras hygrometricum TaxID=472368 RepID=A0A2Z7D8D4_9LAMI|nr:hypothetical protein F511_08325 [Dorcoceras hygrometricum]
MFCKVPTGSCPCVLFFYRLFVILLAQQLNHVFQKLLIQHLRATSVLASVDLLLIDSSADFSSFNLLLLALVCQTSSIHPTGAFQFLLQLIAAAQYRFLSTCWFPLRDVPFGYYYRKIHRLNLSAKAKLCRIHLSKRHRLTTANIKLQRLVKQSTVALDWFFSLALRLIQQLIVTSTLLIPALLNNRNADVMVLILDSYNSNADVIIAEYFYC